MLPWDGRFRWERYWTGSENAGKYALIQIMYSHVLATSGIAVECFLTKCTNFTASTSPLLAPMTAPSPVIVSWVPIQSLYRERKHDAGRLRTLIPTSRPRR